MLAGMARVSVKPYLLGSFLGFIPQMIIFAMAGNGVRLESNQQILISGMLFFVAILLSTSLYYFNSRTNNILYSAKNANGKNKCRM